MDCEESILLQEFTERVNLALHQRGITDRAKADQILLEVIDEAFHSIMGDSSIIPEETKEEVARQLTLSKTRRSVNRQKVQSDIENAFREQLTLSDHCIAFAELISERLEELIVKNAKSLISRKPRPHPVAVTGAMLKCILVLSLHSKISTITEEITSLIRKGHADAADSRLRTLHEHVVILILIVNDQTYELSERYQDHAVFEELGRLRAYKSNFKEFMYGTDVMTTNELEQDIAAAEKDAADALGRWGPSIIEQYGWARPGLPARVRRKQRILFTDLERASGADFLRGDYLTGNNSVHAGPFSAINHLNIGGSRFLRPADYSDNFRIAKIGSCAMRYLRDATGLASKGITLETEEYDEFLISCEMRRAADAATDSFVEVMDSGRVESGPSS